VNPPTSATRRGAACVALACCLWGATGCSNEAAKRRHFDRGEQFLAANQLPEAIIEFRNAVNRDERWGEARLRLADAYAANADPALAYRHYIRAADLLPDDPGAQLKAAAYLLLAGQYEDAKDRAERVLAKHPDSTEAQVTLGNALAGLRDLDGAVSQISEAIQLDPGRSQSYVSLARVRMAQGHDDEARAAFDRAIESDPQSVAAHLARANFQWSIGEAAEAEKSLRRVLEIEPGNVLTRRVLATLYVTSGRAPAAEEHLKFVADSAKTDAPRLELADYYIAAGRADDARRVLEPMANQESSRGAAEVRLARLAYDNGSATEGHRLLDEALRREPNNPTALVLKARWLLSEGEPERALTQAQAALAVSPQLVAALYAQAEAEARTRRTTDAIKSLIDVLRVNPRDANAQTELSALHLARNEAEGAVHAAEEALTNEPESIGARLALVRALTARGDFKNAAAELSPLKKRASDVAAVHVAEGALKMRTSDLKGARQSFDRALQLEPESREAFLGSTTVDVLLGSLEQARARADARLRSSADPEVLRVAAKVYLASGNNATAEDLLRRAIEADPLDCDAPALLAGLLTQSNRLADAVKAFDQTSQQQPDNLGAHVMAAILLHTAGKTADAKERYLAILKREPRVAIAANNLASIYIDEGENLKEAQELAERATELFPNHAGMRDTLGSLYLRRQLPGPALNHFQRSVDADPANPLYVYHLGLAYSQSGDKERAAVAFRQSLRLQPGFAAARTALAALADPVASKPVSR
jgi:putative PEP-CTERM system TPR-repeat lipoprotein